MDAEDVASTFNRLADPDAGSNALSVFNGVLSKGNTKAVDAHHGGVPARRPERQLPVPGQLGQLQRDHPPEGPTTATGRRRSSAPARGSARAVPARRGRQLRPEPRVLGQGAGSRSADESEVRFYANEQSRGPRPARQRGRRARPVLGRGRQGAADRPGHPHDRAQGVGPSPGPPAQLDRAVQGQAHAPGDGAARQPARPGRRPARHEVRLRQRQPVRAGVPLDGQGRRPAPAGRRARRRSCSPPRARRTGSRSSSPAGTASRCRTSRS